MKPVLSAILSPALGAAYLLNHPDSRHAPLIVFAAITLAAVLSVMVKIKSAP